jgi:hypothetical protein
MPSGVTEDEVSKIQLLHQRGKKPAHMILHPYLMDSNLSEDTVAAVVREITLQQAAPTLVQPTVMHSVQTPSYQQTASTSPPQAQKSPTQVRAMLRSR